MKQKKQNRFDLLIEELYSEFSQIPNFQLIQEDENIKQMVSSIIFRIAEVSSYKSLVSSYYIPATNRAIVESKNDLKQSKYRAILNDSVINFKETLYETIRLFYVGLFHKFENYVNDVIQFSNMILLEEFEIESSIADWTGRFGFGMKNWELFNEVHKVNWIANCVKHKDGFPVKDNPPLCFKHLDKDNRIELTKDDFLQDSKNLIEFYPKYLQIIFMFVKHKIIKTELQNKNDYKTNKRKYESQIEQLKKLEEVINKLVEVYKIRI